MTDKPSFKNSMGHWYTLGLFYETVNADKSTVVYTLKDEDHMGFPSLYRLYMEADDPTEFLFAQTYLGGWSHWLAIANASWFKEYAERWRKELELRTKARALQSIKAAAAANGRDALQANRFLVNGGWKEQSKRRAGAPTKAEVATEAAKMAKEANQVQDDYNRLKAN